MANLPWRGGQLSEGFKFTRIVYYSQCTAGEFSSSPGASSWQVYAAKQELRERRDIVDDLVITLSSEVLSTKLCEDSYEVSDVQTYHFPKGPWQHFKHNYMPMWFCDIFPIKYFVKRVEFHKTIKITRRETYPMCNMDIRNNPRLRVQLGTPVIKDEVKIS